VRTEVIAAASKKMAARDKVDELIALAKDYRIRAPESVRGMTVLDRAAFTVQIPVVAVRIPSKLAQSYMKGLSPFLLSLPVCHPEN
jgi:hypothetical protein